MEIYWFDFAHTLYAPHDIIILILLIDEWIIWAASLEKVDERLYKLVCAANILLTLRLMNQT